MFEALVLIAILAAWDSSRRWCERDQEQLEDLEARLQALEPLLARMTQAEQELGKHGKVLTAQALRRV